MTSQDAQAWEPPGMEPLPEFEHDEPEPRTESGESEPQAYEPEEVDEDLASGVTPSADWGMDGARRAPPRPCRCSIAV